MGVVTLTGTVPSYMDKLEAEAAARRVFGVRGIANDLAVSLPGDWTVSDTDIAEAAISSLKWRTPIPEGRVNVAVSNGIVKLEGDVDYYFQKRDAEGVVGSLTGVIGVINNLSIIARITPTSGEVQKEIEDALVRDARLDARGIFVHVEESRVVLEGTVRNWAQLDDAEDAAWSAPGVVDVDNRLEVVP